MAFNQKTQSFLAVLSKISVKSYMSYLKETRNDLTRRYRILIVQKRNDIEALENILTKIENDESLEETKRLFLRKLCNEEIDVYLAHQDLRRAEFLSDNS